MSGNGSDAVNQGCPSVAFVDWSGSEPPKDGSEFLAYDPNHISPSSPDGVFVAMWMEQVEQVGPDVFKDAFVGAVWDDGADAWDAVLINPVMWMPKPKPPADRFAADSRGRL